MFNKDARSLSKAWKASQASYTPVELLLQADAEGGSCAHQDALNAVCRVNDACGHVMLGIVPFDQVIDHLQALPAFDAAELLRSMRRESSRAALHFHGSACDNNDSDKTQTYASAQGLKRLPLPDTAQFGITSSNGPTATFVEPNQTHTKPPSPEAVITLATKDAEKGQQSVAQGAQGAQRPMKQPSNDAFTAYRVWVATGIIQEELAEMLTKELKRPVHQGTVSRWIDQVKSWLEAGNVLPDLSPPLNKKPTAIDPERIDLGERQDHRSERQRERRNSDAGD
jgi:hypothetical protein